MFPLGPSFRRAIYLQKSRFKSGLVEYCLGGEIKMKKIFVLLFATLLLTACAEKQATDDFIKKVDKEVAEQEELDKKLKAEAEPVDFTKINNGEIKKDTKLYVIGKLKSVTDDPKQTFYIVTEEKDGNGMYEVKNLSDTIVEEGAQVKVYGTYEGKGTTIRATIIEKQ